ncbi:MAG TPA: hypothetical protein VL308_10890 [Gemmatimonadaceae bacterium]|nr:hypothetical protein [Gemmatimonadaceae bacterium]
MTSVSNASAPRSGAGVRLANLVVDPVDAFRGIACDPSWRLAFLAAVGVRFGSLFVFYEPSVTPIKALGGLLLQVLTVGPTVLLSSLVVWLVARVWRVNVAWATAFSILMHVYVAFTLATLAFSSVAGALLTESADVDLRNPPFTNLTSLVGGTDSDVVRTLAGEMDVRSTYVLVLLWLGLRGAAPDAPRSAIARALLTIAVVRVVGVTAVSLLR